MKVLKVIYKIIVAIVKNGTIKLVWGLLKQIYDIIRQIIIDIKNSTK